ncbi:MULTISPECIES: thioesterase II family protein [Streptomyces]|uniref:thioesterase II family protein n=1 Tax=Streptomyces TaxID=1883 RepID=UPI000C26ED54|nr:alpha/beta fold hydrolase [Streptomyces sp. CB01201]MBX7464540.1 alpha/beta fold hydrolase [Streptomyces sp. MAG02]PJN04808.1 thioesterase [Streptomyces sp. CB01201]
MNRPPGADAPYRTWLRCYWPRPGARRRLVIFPHGGGSASFYRPFAKRMPPWVEPVVVQYPGREDRLDDPHIDDMDRLVARVSDALLPAFDREVLFFGHSMGASVAHEVAARLETRHGVGPSLLAVSGRPAPRFHKPGDKHLDDAALWYELSRLGATPAALLDNAQVRKVVLPTLRADYRLVERYRPRLDTRVSCTVAACLGDKDPEVTEPEARAWAEVSGGAFAFRLFDGDHFYLRGQEEALASWLLTTADRENP